MRMRDSVLVPAWGLFFFFFPTAGTGMKTGGDGKERRLCGFYCTSAAGWVCFSGAVAINLGIGDSRN
jgi:hypothetical protein